MTPFANPLQPLNPAAGADPMEEVLSLQTLAAGACPAGDYPGTGCCWTVSCPVETTASCS